MIFGPTILGNNATLLAEVRDLFHAARAAADFEALRTEPTGAEIVLWCTEPDDAQAERLVGFVLVTVAGPGLHALDLIYVIPPRRGFGVGKALIASAIDAARKLGGQKILIGLTDGARTMEHLAAGAGFQPAGTIAALVLNPVEEEPKG